MITITLTFRTVEAARQALLEIPSSALVGGPEMEPAAAAPVPAPAPKAPKPPKPAPTPAAPAVAPEVVAEPAPAAESPSKPVTSEEVRAFLAPFLRDADNVAKVQSLLKEFDAPRLSSIPADKLGEFLTKAKEVFA